MSKKVQSNDIHKIEEKVKGFNLPLPTIVEGKDTSGKPFREQTVLSYISHFGSSFWLTTPVSLDQELRLIVSLPPKLAPDKNLNLIIKGKTVFIEASKGKSQQQRVSLKFQTKYIIEAEEIEIA
ncbi:MAG: PilZ domain-containing protein [Candidatus Aminicenantes bacterium]|nr:MAG: PilZ domain-containing protein [Candidatus Aminicenantes bacterium]